MKFARLFVSIIALGLLLSGCAPTAQIAPNTTAPGMPSASSTPEVPRATAVILTLDALSVRDQTGAELQSAQFANPDAIIALIDQLTGSKAEPVDNHQFGQTYQWAGITCVKNFGICRVRITSTEVGGLPLATSQGIHIGSTRAEVMALNPFDTGYDQNGDGVSDNFGIEQRQMPGTQSLKFPGQTGTAFISVGLQGDVVVSIGSPSNDYQDI